ncbi:MAG: metal ABC transporter substrate-binding protein [Xenococcus sp. MO_188.B8]|nr:metal ABC transporter substrate-binding protein [Xenococcus sp. MO_188.B8]
MKISYPVLLLFLLFGTIALTSCSTPNSQSNSSSSQIQVSNSKPIIYVTNYPLKYFAEYIGGDTIQVQFPIPTDVDPAFWQPNAEIISQLQQGDLILLNGATYEKWLDKVSLPESKLINTSSQFQDQYIPRKSAITHSHGPEGEHSHTDIAFTTWLNLKFAIKQAQSIRDALSEIMPEKKETFRANYQALEKDLLDLDRQIQNIVATNPEQNFIASHPVYHYLKQRYGIKLESVHWEPENYPTKAQWQELKVLLQKHPAKWMIWEADPDSETVAQLKTMGINSLVFASVANAPDTGDFFGIMQQNIENLKQAFP